LVVASTVIWATTADACGASRAEEVCSGVEARPVAVPGCARRIRRALVAIDANAEWADAYIMTPIEKY